MTKEHFDAQRGPSPTFMYHLLAWTLPSISFAVQVTVSFPDTIGKGPAEPGPPEPISMGRPAPTSRVSEGSSNAFSSGSSAHSMGSSGTGSAVAELSSPPSRSTGEPQAEARAKRV